MGEGWAEPQKQTLITNAMVFEKEMPRRVTKTIALQTLRKAKKLKKETQMTKLKNFSMTLTKI